MKGIRVLALLPICILYSAECETFALKEFVARSLDSHPFLQATSEEINNARAELLSSQGAFDPVMRGYLQNYPTGDYSGSYGDVSVEQPLQVFGSKLIAGYRRGGGNFPIYEDYYATNNDGEFRAGIEVPILRDGSVDRRRASISRAAKHIENTELSLEQRKVELARAAAHAYMEWYGALRKHAAYAELLRTAKDRDKQLTKRANAGDIARIDQVDNQRQVLQRQSQLVGAARALSKAGFEARLFLWNESGVEAQGLDQHMPLVNLKPPPRLTNDPTFKAIDIALTNRVEHKRVHNLIQQQQIESEFAQNQILPRLDLQIVGANDFGNGSDSRDETEIKTGLRIEVPLATRSQRGRIQAIESKRRELIQQYRVAEARIRIDVIDATNALILAHERLRLASKEVAVARELEKAERKKFEQGESTLIFVNLREQGSVDALVREIDAMVDCWKSYTSYLAAKGDVFV